MQLKACLVVMMMQRLLQLRWDSPAVYTTIGYGQTVMYNLSKESILATRSICLVIRCYLCYQ